MIIYAYITKLSVGALFAGGCLPGLLMGGLLLIISTMISLKRRYPRRERRASLGEILRAAGNALLALFIPVVILGSILSGVATVVESAAVAAGYTYVVGRFVFRTLCFRDLIPAARYTAKLTGVIFLLICTAHTFGWYITRIGVPAKIGTMILGTTTEPILILLMLNIFLLLVGMLMDILPAVLILAPVFGPFAVKIGIDPLHFALVMMVNLNIGMITPPYGMTLLTAARIADCSYDSVIRAVLPFLIAELVTLLFTTYVPGLVLWLPRMLGFSG
jgi:tripartite ATP-independent transporter DctM subunit